MSHWNDATYTVEHLFIIDLEDYILDHAHFGASGQTHKKSQKMWNSSLD